jgi:hypothetical protein
MRRLALTLNIGFLLRGNPLSRKLYSINKLRGRIFRPERYFQPLTDELHFSGDHSVRCTSILHISRSTGNHLIRLTKIEDRDNMTQISGNVKLSKDKKIQYRINFQIKILAYNLVLNLYLETSFSWHASVFPVVGKFRR